MKIHASSICSFSARKKFTGAIPLILPADIRGLINGPASTGPQYDGDGMPSAGPFHRDAFARVTVVPCYAGADWGIRDGAQRRESIASPVVTTSAKPNHTIQTCPHASAFLSLRKKQMASAPRTGAQKTAAAGFQLITLGFYHHEYLKT